MCIITQNQNAWLQHRTGLFKHCKMIISAYLFTYIRSEQIKTDSVLGF